MLLPFPKALLLVGALALAPVLSGCAANAQGTPQSGYTQEQIARMNANVDVINRYYQAYASGDLNNLRPFFADDIVWRIPGQHPLAGEKRGADEVLAFFAQLGKDGFQAEPIVLAAGGDWVIDLHRGFSTRGQGRLDITWALAFRIQNGKIVEAINFAYDQAAANAFFWANHPLKPLPDRLQNP